MDAEKIAKLIATIATCLGALVALWKIIVEIIQIIVEVLRLKSACMEGRWWGTYSSGGWDEWIIEGKLRLHRRDILGRIPVSGCIRWKLDKCSPELSWAKRIGESACEVVEGELRNEILGSVWQITSFVR